jgi:hypothetical protein
VVWAVLEDLVLEMRQLCIEEGDVFFIFLNLYIQICLPKYLTVIIGGL